MSVTKSPTARPEVYDKTTIGLHWTIAMLVAIQFLIGRTTNFLPRGPLRVDIWSVHVLFGFTLTAVVIAGIIWRATRGRRLARRSAVRPIFGGGDAPAAGSAAADHGRARHHQCIRSRLSDVQSLALSEARRRHLHAPRQCMAWVLRQSHYRRGAVSRHGGAVSSLRNERWRVAEDVATPVELAFRVEAGRREISRSLIADRRGPRSAPGRRSLPRGPLAAPRFRHHLRHEGILPCWILPATH